MKKLVKKILIVLLAMATIVPMAGCKKAQALDYSKTENWMRLGTDGKSVDVFFVCPTLVYSTESGTDFATVSELKVFTQSIYRYQACVYAESCNVYMPAYRQATLDSAATCNMEQSKYLELLKNNIPYLDITAALDYYFANYNNNKPFILAAHSQGSAMLINVLTGYMQQHTEYLSRMIATYCIGFAPSEEIFETYTNLHFAEGEEDTGVVISWNTEGPQASGKSILLPEHPMVINPLNWSRISTNGFVTATIEQLDSNTQVQVGTVNAMINATRGTIVCTESSVCNATAYTEAPGLFQSQSLHELDYSLYFGSIKTNVAKRINAYLNK